MILAMICRMVFHVSLFLMVFRCFFKGLMTFLGFSCRVAELGEGSEGGSSEARELGSSGARKFGRSEGRLVFFSRLTLR
jgi:hypothetical protein